MYKKVRRLRIFDQKEEFPVQEFLFKEYDQLRNEIMTRTGIQHQIISLTLVATGTFIVLESTLVKLFYPILAMFLALTWMQNDIRIGQIGYYICHKIEPKEPKIGWEHFYRRRPDLAVGGSFAHLASQGILCGTQVFVLLACLLLNRLNQIETILFGIDIVVIIITIIIVRPHRLACAFEEEDL